MLDKILGTLIAWMRTVYPDLTIGGIASSGAIGLTVNQYSKTNKKFRPINFQHSKTVVSGFRVKIHPFGASPLTLLLKIVVGKFKKFIGYAVNMQKDYGSNDPNCAGNIKTAFTQMQTMVYSETGRQVLEILFKQDGSFLTFFNLFFLAYVLHFHRQTS